MKKSAFFDFLNRYTNTDFESFLARSKEDVDYINWHDYCLPMTYGDEASEYKAVRSTCAMFDASPIKKYKISGADAGPFLDAVMTRQMSRQKPMRVSYAVLCNEDGMLLDDGLLYKFSEDSYLLMVSEIDHDEHFAKVSNRFGDLKIDEITPSLSGLAFQGPKSCEILNCIGFSSIENLKPFEIKDVSFGGGNVTIARVGFTADLGYEVWLEPQLNKAVEQAIRKAEDTLGIKIDGYGLTALNSLRLEGGFIVPGWDTAQTFEDNEYERTPAELGISWTVDLDRKDDFIGKTALLKEREMGPRFKTTGLTINQECDFEDGMKIYTVMDDKVLQVGTLPSVAWSYGLKCWIGIASIQSFFLSEDLNYHVQIGGEQIACRSMKLPFVKFDRYRQVPAPF
ncbi:MAG: aminomethyltransferase family protein [Deltaproteobacteria bacterium]|nr:aminomethyltransferase family protein [Deltaproteobacteria bacterium]